MTWNTSFFENSVLLGIGLSMDAFSISLVNGMREPKMPIEKMCGIAGVYGIFQAIMPIIGWIFVHTLSAYFQTLENYIFWIGAMLLTWIGGRMLLDGFCEEEYEPTALFIQGAFTSIDALSVGFTIVNYHAVMALTEAGIIAIITFCICMIGLAIGRRFGVLFSRQAPMVGGIILISLAMNLLYCKFS